MENQFNSSGINAAYATDIKNLIESASVFRQMIPDTKTRNATTGDSHFFNKPGHPGEEGRWTESLISEFLRRHLPRNLEVSTGFIADPRTGRRSYQVDILVYDHKYPPIFKYGEAVIVHPLAARAAISVKYALRKENLKYELQSMREIGDICNKTGGYGPYLAIVGFSIYRTPSQRDPEATRSTNWKTHLADPITEKIIKIYKGFSEENPKLSANEVIDSVLTLDGYLLHASKGSPLTENASRRNVKLMWGGLNGDKQYVLGAELIGGIMKRQPVDEMQSWPSRSGVNLSKRGEIPIVCFGRPPRKG